MRIEKFVKLTDEERAKVLKENRLAYVRQEVIDKVNFAIETGKCCAYISTNVCHLDELKEIVDEFNLTISSKIDPFSFIVNLVNIAE